MKNKKLTGILIATIIILLVCVVGTTFAYYFATLRGKNENTISTSKATLILTEQEYANNSIEMLPDAKGPEWGTAYKFTLSYTSDKDMWVGYALYMEPAEENTIDPNLIHIHLSSDKDSEVAEVFNEKPIYCYNYETGEVVEGSEGIGCINNYDNMATEPEILDDGTEIRYVNYYGKNNQSLCMSYMQIKTADGYWETSGKGDGENCVYGEIQELHAYKLNGNNSFTDYHERYGWNIPRYGNFTIDELFSKNLGYLIYTGRMGSTWKSEQTFTLRYWLSEEELAKQGTAEGTVNDDGSISAEIGEEGIFKFKIGVYAKTLMRVSYYS